MPASFDRCVKKVKAKGGVTNPYAVCRGSMGSDAQIKEREMAKKKEKGVLRWRILAMASRSRRAVGLM